MRAFLLKFECNHFFFCWEFAIIFLWACMIEKEGVTGPWPTLTRRPTSPKNIRRPHSHILPTEKKYRKKSTLPSLPSSSPSSATGWPIRDRPSPAVLLLPHPRPISTQGASSRLLLAPRATPSCPMPRCSGYAPASMREKWAKKDRFSSRNLCKKTTGRLVLAARRCLQVSLEAELEVQRLAGGGSGGPRGPAGLVDRGVAAHRRIHRGISPWV